MSRGNRRKSYRGVSIAAIAIAALLGLVVADINPIGGPQFIGLPDEIDFGLDLLVAAISDHPPVQIQVTVDGNDVPGSPDTGADTPGSINTGTFRTSAYAPGTQLVVKATDAANQSVTRIVRIK